MFLSSASNISMYIFSVTFTLFKFTTVKDALLSLICSITSAGWVRLGSSGGNSFNGVAFVTPFQPIVGSALGAFSDWDAWYWSCSFIYDFQCLIFKGTSDKTYPCSYYIDREVFLIFQTKTSKSSKRMLNLSATIQPLELKRSKKWCNQRVE